MTVITKPIISEKKSNSLKVPLVDSEVPASVTGRVDEESGDYYTQQPRSRISTATTVCLFLTALLVMSIGVIGGVYLYKQFARSQTHRYLCNIPFDADSAKLTDNINVLEPSSDDEVSNFVRHFFKEEFDLDIETDMYEKIDVPDFKEGRRGRFIHDFVSNKTGIVDLDGRRCFVMQLDRQRILPPRSMVDVIKKLVEGTYEVDTEVIRVTMKVVTPPVRDFSNVGVYIERECRGFPTYMLEKSDRSKRSTTDEVTTFVEFGGKNIMYFNLINMDDVKTYENAVTSN